MDEVEVVCGAVKNKDIRLKHEIEENQVIITIPEQKFVITFPKPIKEVEISAGAKISAQLIERVPRKEWEMSKIRNEIPSFSRWFEKSDEVRKFIVENELYDWWLVEFLVKNEPNKAMEMLKGTLWKITPIKVYSYTRSYPSNVLNLYYNGKTHTFYKNHLVFKIFSLLNGEIVGDSDGIPIFYSPENWLGLIVDLETRKKKKVLEALQKDEPLEKIKTFVISNFFFGGEKWERVK